MNAVTLAAEEIRCFGWFGWKGAVAAGVVLLVVVVVVGALVGKTSRRVSNSLSGAERTTADGREALQLLSGY